MGHFTQNKIPTAIQGDVYALGAAGQGGFYPFIKKLCYVWSFRCERAASLHPPHDDDLPSILEKSTQRKQSQSCLNRLHFKGSLVARYSNVPGYSSKANLLKFHFMGKKHIASRITYFYVSSAIANGM